MDRGQCYSCKESCNLNSQVCGKCAREGLYTMVKPGEVPTRGSVPTYLPFLHSIMEEIIKIPYETVKSENYILPLTFPNGTMIFFQYDQASMTQTVMIHSYYELNQYASRTIDTSTIIKMMTDWSKADVKDFETVYDNEDENDRDTPRNFYIKRNMRKTRNSISVEIHFNFRLVR